MSISGNRTQQDPNINIGDAVLDEWTEADISPKIGIVMDFTPETSFFPYLVCWNSGDQFEYDGSEILEMKAAYEKYRL